MTKENLMNTIKEKVLSILKNFQKKTEENKFGSIKQDGSFFERGQKILENNGWVKNGDVWSNPNYKDFKIYEMTLLREYHIKHNESGYKTVKIVKTENILKRISEFKIHVKSRQKRITKDSFLSDFE